VTSDRPQLPKSMAKRETRDIVSGAASVAKLTKQQEKVSLMASRSINNLNTISHRSTMCYRHRREQLRTCLPFEGPLCAQLELGLPDWVG
jgi:hypothetical protein